MNFLLRKNHLLIFFLMFLFIFLLVSNSNAEERTELGVWQKTKNIFSNIVDAESLDVYLSGYAYHERQNYTDSQLQKLNDKTWGGGVGKTVRTENGNEESLYVMEIRDSVRKPQWMVGYAYEFMYSLHAAANLDAGVGVTALILRRSDWVNGVPFPAVLPFASFGTKNIRLMAILVPQVSLFKNKGNVIMVFAKISYK